MQKDKDTEKPDPEKLNEWQERYLFEVEMLRKTQEDAAKRISEALKKLGIE